MVCIIPQSRSRAVTNILAVIATTFIVDFPLYTIIKLIRSQEG